MFCITYKKKPQTIGMVAAREKGKSGYGMDVREAESYFVGKNKKATREYFMYYSGFTWAEWQEAGYEIHPLKVLV